MKNNPISSSQCNREKSDGGHGGDGGDSGDGGDGGGGGLVFGVY